MKLKKGDNCIVITGKDKGKHGKVLQTFPSTDRILLEAINIKKVHVKGKKKGEKGQVVDRAMPMHVSNVAILDPKSGKASKIGYKIEKDKKIRIYKKTGSAIA